ncbi:MAG: hypothetical protein Q9207_008291 [Kuettlingeria erythrocarpa]
MSGSCGNDDKEEEEEEEQEDNDEEEDNSDAGEDNNNEEEDNNEDEAAPSWRPDGLVSKQTSHQVQPSSHEQLRHCQHVDNHAEYDRPEGASSHGGPNNALNDSAAHQSTTALSSIVPDSQVNYQSPYLPSDVPRVPESQTAGHNPGLCTEDSQTYHFTPFYSGNPIFDSTSVPLVPESQNAGHNPGLSLDTEDSQTYHFTPYYSGNPNLNNTSFACVQNNNGPFTYSFINDSHSIGHNHVGDGLEARYTYPDFDSVARRITN